jgi:hypothetical protein
VQLKTLDKIIRKDYEKAIREEEREGRRESETEIERKFRTLSVQTRKTNRYESLQAKETERGGLSRERSGSKIRFRTTGAGFRQKINKKIQP